MWVDLDLDLSFKTFCKTLKLIEPTKHAKRIICWEDYIFDRVHEIFFIHAAHVDEGEPYSYAFVDRCLSSRTHVMLTRHPPAWPETPALWSAVVFDHVGICLSTENVGEIPLGSQLFEKLTHTTHPPAS